MNIQCFPKVKGQDFKFMAIKHKLWNSLLKFKHRMQKIMQNANKLRKASHERAKSVLDQ